MEELKQWYNQISLLPKLKIAVAQDLYKKFINTKDEKLRKIYMDKLILGTLYVVYDHIKRNELEIFVSSSYDISDIISSFNGAWIRKLYNGELLSVDQYSSLFTSSFYNEVYESLCGDEIMVKEQFKVSIDYFTELLALYVLYKNREIDKSFEKVIEERYFTNGRNSWSYYIYNDVIRIIPLFERIYSNLNFDKLENLNLTKTKIADYLRLIINVGLFEPISDGIPDKIDLEDSITTNILMECFIDDVDKILINQTEREVIHERFGLNGDNPQTLEIVGKHQGVTRARVGQIEAKALIKLRGNPNIRKYKGENI